MAAAASPAAPSTPATPTNGSASAAASILLAKPNFVPLVCVVDFHHARGPEVERWFGADEGEDPATDNDWRDLPFMALSDGAHASTEDFSYFTLLRPATDTTRASSLFGISCTRQMDASQLINRPAEVTRSTVQKAVVVIADTPQHFGMLRERLSVVTKAWFAQCEFTDVEILRRFQESLEEEKERGGELGADEADDRDTFLGLSLREMIHEFRWQTLVLLKCCLLQPKMLFFGSRCERLCMAQFSLISLIPGLLRNLGDSAGPELDTYEKTLVRPTSLRTSDRTSLLSYMGLPLQIFGKGSLFGPYTPLQQLDVLADYGTKSYVVGSTNSLLLQQRDRYSDILINLDDVTVNITSTSLRTALQLSVADRRWIDFLTQAVNDTWDDANPGRPKTMGYVGSEEFIRLQFEEYILSLISCAKYHDFLVRHAHDPRVMLPHIDGDPSIDFGPDFVEAWSRTDNHRIWNSHTDSHLFDIVEPKHPCAGGLTIDDVQRRIAQQVQDLHLDERFAQGREVLGRNLAAGREKASSMFNRLYADMEALREAQRKRAEEARAARPPVPPGSERNGGGAAGGGGNPGGQGVDLAKAQQTMHSVGMKAGAYMNSWAAWADGKRKAAGWGRPGAGANGAGSRGDEGGPAVVRVQSGGSWTSGWGRSRNSPTTASHPSLDSASEKDYQPLVGGPTSPRLSTSSKDTFAATSAAERSSTNGRPLTQGSFSESIFDAAGSESGTTSSQPASPRRDKDATPLASPGEPAAAPAKDAAAAVATSPLPPPPSAEAAATKAVAPEHPEESAENGKTPDAPSNGAATTAA